MDNELRERLKEIEIENIFFAVFIILIILSYIANEIEKNYFINGFEESKTKYYYIQIFIFIVVVLSNIYYVWNSYQNVVFLSDGEYSKREKYAKLNLVASLFALIAGVILLYIAVTDNNIDAEISL